MFNYLRMKPNRLRAAPFKTFPKYFFRVKKPIFLTLSMSRERVTWCSLKCLFKRLWVIFNTCLIYSRVGVKRPLFTASVTRWSDGWFYTWPFTTLKFVLQHEKYSKLGSKVWQIPKITSKWFSQNLTKWPNLVTLVVNALLVCLYEMQST